MSVTGGGELHARLRLEGRLRQPLLCAVGALAALLLAAAVATAQNDLPLLTAPVNDFANVIDATTTQSLDALIRSLQQASGDVVVVATVDTFAPFADIREFAVELFENQGRGIGQRGRDNGLLVVVAVRDRQVWVEVGYELEQFVTDGFAGETSREYMVPEFRRGAYGAGLLAGVTRIVSRIAEGRQVTLQGVRPPRPRSVPDEVGPGGSLLLALFILFIVLNALAGRVQGNRRRFGRRWGGRSWGGWSSGVGPFGGSAGGFGGGFGGFGGFGGGRSGGGGGGARW
jgi:uncharacterized protein